MFPFAPLPLHHTELNQSAPSRLESRPKNRLEHQQAMLEYKKMNHAEFLNLSRYYNDRGSSLERHRQITDARGNNPTSGEKLRNVLARFLISTGERIRPEATAHERAFNA